MWMGDGSETSWIKIEPAVVRMSRGHVYQATKMPMFSSELEMI